MPPLIKLIKKNKQMSTSIFSTAFYLFYSCKLHLINLIKIIRRVQTGDALILHFALIKRTHFFYCGIYFCVYIYLMNVQFRNDVSHLLS